MKGDMGHDVKKRCTKCGEEKDLEEFPRKKTGKNGRRSMCTLCTAAANAKWYYLNRKRSLKSSAKWASENRDRMNKSSAKWVAANPEDAAVGHRKDAAQDRDRHQRQIKARREVTEAIRTNRLVVGPCAVCDLAPKKVKGRQRIQAHHHKGYAPKCWLDVIWLCVPDHIEADKEKEMAA